MKGFITQDGVAEPGDRAGMRRQAAAQIWALRAELVAGGWTWMPPPEALLVLATPFSPGHQCSSLERLDAELDAVAAALKTLAATEAQLAALLNRTPLSEALRRLPIRFRESCLTSCAMVDCCKSRTLGLTGAVGDAAEHLGTADLARTVALLSGAAPADPAEQQLIDDLHAAATIFGWGWP
jgi:hypothetical protein